MPGLPSMTALLAGGAIILAIVGAAVAYNVAENRGIRQTVEAETKLEAEKHTMEAINALSSRSDKARVGLLYCRSNGLQYDFAGNKCI